MANAPRLFSSKGTRVFHGHANATLYECRLLQRDTSGYLILCAASNKSCGVSPANFASGDDVDYHRAGICTVLTDGSAAIGDTVKATTAGIAIKDVSAGGTPSVFSAGVLLTLDATSNIGDVELFS
jgi:hypothetical protein